MQRFVLVQQSKVSFPSFLVFYLLPSRQEAASQGRPDGLMHRNLTQPDLTQQAVLRIRSRSLHALRSTTYSSSVSLLSNQTGFDWNYHFDALTFKSLNKAENDLSACPSGCGEAEWHQLWANTRFNLIHASKYSINIGRKKKSWRAWSLLTTETAPHFHKRPSASHIESIRVLPVHG